MSAVDRRDYQPDLPLGVVRLGEPLDQVMARARAASQREESEMGAVRPESEFVDRKYPRCRRSMPCEMKATETGVTIRCTGCDEVSTWTRPSETQRPAEPGGAGGR
jgi:hypothetical protein